MEEKQTTLLNSHMSMGLRKPSVKSYNRHISGYATLPAKTSDMRQPLCAMWQLWGIENVYLGY